MATITLSPLLVDIRGKVQDTVYAIWKGRNYIRSRVTPANPKSVAQIKQRAIMTAAVGFWQGLHETLVEAWNRVATPYRVSGYNLCSDNNASTAPPNGDGNYARMEVAAVQLPRLMRPTPGAKALEDFVPAAHATEQGAITCTWTSTGWTPADKVMIAALLDTAETYYAQQTVPTVPADATLGTADISGLDPNETYTVTAVGLYNDLKATTATVGDKGVAPHV